MAHIPSPFLTPGARGRFGDIKSRPRPSPNDIGKAQYARIDMATRPDRAKDRADWTLVEGRIYWRDQLWSDRVWDNAEAAAEHMEFCTDTYPGETPEIMLRVEKERASKKVRQDGWTATLKDGTVHSFNVLRLEDAKDMLRRKLKRGKRLPNGTKWTDGMEPVSAASSATPECPPEVVFRAVLPDGSLHTINEPSLARAKVALRKKLNRKRLPKGTKWK